MFRCASLRASSRKHNEDRAEVFDRGDDLVVVVADGAGGMRGGAAASGAIVAAVRAAALDVGFDIHEVQSWTSLLGGVDQTLAKRMAGETTAIVAVISPDGVLGVSCGDSEAWLVTETGIDDITAGQNKKRLGSGRAAPLPFYRPTLDGALVLGTDGLWKYISTERAAEAVRGRAPSAAAEALRALVQLRSGKYQDDVGLVVVAPVSRSTG